MIRRVQLRLFAKSYPEIVQMQLDIAKEKDKEFGFSNLREVYSKGEVVGFAVNYHYTLKPGDKVRVS